MIEEASFLGMKTVLWSRSAIDWGVLADVYSIADRLGRAGPGDILLCHDAARSSNQPGMTLAVLPGLLERCQRRGLYFADGYQLLAEGKAAPHSLSEAQSV